MSRVAFLILGFFLLAGQATAATITFSKVVDSNTPVPGGSGNFDSVRDPSISDGNVAFRGVQNTETIGIYRSAGGSLNVVADLSTPVPGGSGTFESFRDPSVSGENVVFRGLQDTDTLGIYRSLGGTLDVVADQSTPVPGGSGSFESFRDPSISGGNVAFRGFQTDESIGVFRSVGGNLSVVADQSTPVPGGSGNFESVLDPSISGESVVFRGEQDTDTLGIYRSAGGMPNVVADLSTPVPGGSGTFESFRDSSTSGENVAFRGLQNNDTLGIYRSVGGTLDVVADQSTPVPDGSGSFDGFGATSISGSNVAFAAATSPGRDEIFVSFGGVLMKVVGLFDVLDGKTIDGLSIGPRAMSGDQLAFRAVFTDSSNGIYVATIPEPLTILLLGGGLIALAGSRRRARPTAD